MAHHCHHLNALYAALRLVMSTRRDEGTWETALGLPEGAASSLRTVRLQPWANPGQPALTLVFDHGFSARSLPRALCSPVAGELVPVHSVLCDAVAAAQTCIRAWNDTHNAVTGTLGAILRLDAEPERLMALTAGHVCGAANFTVRGDSLTFDPEGSGLAYPFNGVLLDWQPNFERLATGCDIDAGIAEVDANEIASLVADPDPMPVASAPLRRGNLLRLRTRGIEITGRDFEYSDVKLCVAGDSSLTYLLRNAIAWRCSEPTQGGDSGAPLWNERDELVGIHAGGGEENGEPWAYFVPIEPILQWVGASVVRRGESLYQAAPPVGMRTAPMRATTSDFPSDAFADETDLADVLARTMWGEARGEGKAGMAAVGHVVFNRVDAQSWWGSTVEDVCRKPFQFSCWNSNDPNRARLLSLTAADATFRIAFQIATELQTAQAIGARVRNDPTQGATHYYAPARVRKPLWAVGLVPCARIGGHDFFAGVA